MKKTHTSTKLKPYKFLALILFYRLKKAVIANKVNSRVIFTLLTSILPTNKAHKFKANSPKFRRFHSLIYRLFSAQATLISLIFSRQNVAKVALQTAFKPKYNARFEPSFAREPLVCHFDKFVAIFIQIRDFFSYKFATFQLWLIFALSCKSQANIAKFANIDELFLPFVH